MGDAATTNGDIFAQSQTFKHITSYPTVKSLIDTVQSNQYGSKSIELTTATYERLLAAFQPLLETSASYAKPYALKIDEYGNFFLDKVDERVPILQSETEDVKNTIIGYINWGPEKVGDAKKKVFDVYNDEYKKCGGDGIIAGGKALITSSLVLTSETLTWLSSYLAARKDEAKDFAQKTEQEVLKAAKEFKDHARGTAQQAEKKTRETAGEAEKYAKDYANKAEKKTKETADDAEKYAKDTADKAEKKTKETADEAGKKVDENTN